MLYPRTSRESSANIGFVATIVPAAYPGDRREPASAPPSHEPDRRRAEQGRTTRSASSLVLPIE